MTRDSFFPIQLILLRNHSENFIRAFHDCDATWPCNFFSPIAFFRVISVFGTFLNNLVIYLVKDLATTDFLKINKTKRPRKIFRDINFRSKSLPNWISNLSVGFYKFRPNRTVFRVTREGFKWHTGGKNETLFPPNSTLILALHHFWIYLGHVITNHVFKIWLFKKSFWLR